MDAVDQMLTQVGSKDLSDVPQMGPIRRTLLERALAFYQGLCEEEGERADVQQERATAQVRCGMIYSQMGKLPDAERAYREAIATIETLPPEVRAADRNRNTLVVAQRSLGTLLDSMGRLEDAEKTFQAGLRVAAELRRSIRHSL